MNLITFSTGIFHRISSISAILFIGALYCIPIVAFAQPTGLSASYKKYPNRIELYWEANGAQHHYIIQRREKTQKNFIAIDTVAQNRYIDRNRLRSNMEYAYRVQSVTPEGTASAPSKEAVGALLVMANEHNDNKDSIPPADCFQLHISVAKATANLLAVRFNVGYTCKTTQAATISLFYSANEILDEKDTLLAQQSFSPSRKRGAFAVKNNTGTTKGYAILQIESEGHSSILTAPWSP